MFGLGGNELIIILVIVMVLFGGAKIPEMMRGMGQGMREFKKATRDDDDDRSMTDRNTTDRSTTTDRV